MGSRGGAPRSPASPREAARGFEPPPRRTSRVPGPHVGEGNWRRGKKPTPQPRQPRRRRPRPRPGGAPAARRRDARSVRTAAATTRLPPSGLRKFPSDRSDAPEGERGGSRAPSAGPALGREDGRKDGRDGKGDTLGRRAEAARGGEDPGAGGTGAARRNVPPIPRPTGGVADRPTTAGKPSSRRRRSRVTTPSVRVAATGTEARRPGGPDRARLPPPACGEGGERASAPPRAFRGTASSGPERAPRGGGRTGRHHEGRPRSEPPGGGRRRTGRPSAGPSLPSASLTLSSRPRARGRPSGTHPDRSSSTVSRRSRLPTRTRPCRSPPGADRRDGPRRSPATPRSASVGAAGGQPARPGFFPCALSLWGRGEARRGDGRGRPTRPRETGRRPEERVGEREKPGGPPPPPPLNGPLRAPVRATDPAPSSPPASLAADGRPQVVAP